MRWISVYLLGYVLLMGGVILALWKWGILDELGPFWTLVSALIVLGIGVMVAVSHSGRKETIEIDSK